MEQRSFQEKRSPSKTSKQRFKPPLFLNEEKNPIPANQSQSQPHEILVVEPLHKGNPFQPNPTSGRTRTPRSAEKGHSKRSGNSISGGNVFEDDDALLTNPQGAARSLPDTVQVHGQGTIMILRGLMACTWTNNNSPGYCIINKNNIFFQLSRFISASQSCQQTKRGG